MKRFFTLISIFYYLIASSQTDTINSTRLKYFVAGNVTLYAGSGIVLNSLWYKKYSTGSFHFFNDSKEWLQIDKAGHAFSSYYLSKISDNGFNWVGNDDKKSAIYGSLLGVLYISSVEIFDGFSENWGASTSDLVADIGGSAFYLSQQLLWKEQRIIPKFSFHTTKYSEIRPNLLGSNFGEQLIKDYNGQTYWLSFNIKSLTRVDKFPGWLNMAVGYGATGMVGGSDNSKANIPVNSDLDFIRRRQYYVSLDIDFSRIKTNSKFLNKVFSVINVLKFPLPTVHFSNNKVEFYPLYF